MIVCLLTLMAKRSAGEMAFFWHDFVILMPQSSNGLSHFPGPAIYNSGYWGNIQKICTKFRTEIRTDIAIYRTKFPRKFTVSILKLLSSLLFYFKGIAHVRDKRQFWSNATVSDAIFVDLPRLRKMPRRDSAAERQATRAAIWPNWRPDVKNLAFSRQPWLRIICLGLQLNFG